MTSRLEGAHRALVQRHTPAGRAFFSVLLRLAGDDPEDCRALLEAAAAGPAAWASWLDGFARARPDAAVALEQALQQLAPPTPGPSRAVGPRMRRVREVVRGAARLALWTDDEARATV